MNAVIAITPDLINVGTDRRGPIDQTDPFNLLTDASALGWPPGYWPKTIRATVGNSLDFRATAFLPDGGLRYEQVGGCITLDVLND